MRKYIQNKFGLLLLVLGIVTGCAGTDDRQQRQLQYEKITEELKQELSKIDLTDGVNKAEATVILQNYIGKHGVPVETANFGELELKNSEWVAPLMSIWTQRPAYFYRINAQTGSVSSTYGPTYSVPRDIWK